MLARSAQRAAAAGRARAAAVTATRGGLPVLRTADYGYEYCGPAVPSDSAQPAPSAPPWRSFASSAEPPLTRTQKTSRELKAEKLGLKYTRGQPQEPWLPTDQLLKRKTYFKRMAFLVQELEKEEIQERAADTELPKFGPGDELSVTLVTPENRRRETVVMGTCIARRNAGLRSSFTIRNAIGNEGYERRFPLYSPNIKKVEVLARRKVRRSKLYYLRERAPKEFRVG